MWKSATRDAMGGLWKKAGTHFAVKTVEEARRVQVCPALVAGQAVLVEEPSFGHDLLSFEDLRKHKK